MATMTAEWWKAHQEQLRQAFNEHFRDSFVYGFAAFDQHRPPLHGAIDFSQGADGVWRIPTIWSDGDTIHFGIDPARPGSDFTTYTVWSRR